MAVLNLINSSYSGSLGSTTGTKWKSKSVVKAKIWSKTPNNETQTNSVRSFEALNRVSSAIAKKWFYWLGIKAQNMHKHNAVAHLLKKCVETHRFMPIAILDVFKPNGTVSVNDFEVNYETGQIDCTFTTSYEVAVDKTKSWLVLIFTAKGNVLYSEVPQVSSKTVSFIAPIAENDVVYAMALSSAKLKKGYDLGGYGLPMYVVDGCLYTTNLQQSIWEYVGAGLARAIGEGASVSSGKLVLTN